KLLSSGKSSMYCVSLSIFFMQVYSASASFGHILSMRINTPPQFNRLILSYIIFIIYDTCVLIYLFFILVNLFLIIILLNCNILLLILLLCYYIIICNF